MLYEVITSIGPTGWTPESHGDLSTDEVSEAFRAQAEILASTGVDPYVEIKPRRRMRRSR